MENDKKINNEIFNNILEIINKYNIQLYNIEIIKDLLSIRLNNLLINKDILENLIKELNNKYSICYYNFKNYLLIDIKINSY